MGRSVALCVITAVQLGYVHVESNSPALLTCPSVRQRKFGKERQDDTDKMRHR